MVVVPISWPHAVANVCNGLKLAGDGLLPGDLANMVFNYQQVIGRYKHVQNTDYVGVMRVMHGLMGQVTQLATSKTVWNGRLYPTTAQSGHQGGPSMIPSTSVAPMPAQEGPSTSATSQAPA